MASGCAVGPLVSQEPARTLGYGKHEMIFGAGQAGYALKWNFGVAENVDVGLQWESLSLGLRAKYAFINRKEGGWSVAGAGGIGTSIGGNHYYGDLLASHLADWFEPYGTLRIVHVTTDPVEFKSQTTGVVNFRIQSANYDYGQFMLGSRFWLSKTWMLSVEASTLFPVSAGLGFGSNLIIGAAAGFRF